MVLGGGKRDGVPAMLLRLVMGVGFWIPVGLDIPVGCGNDGFTGLGIAEEALAGEGIRDLSSRPAENDAGLRVGSLDKRLEDFKGLAVEEE